MYNSMDTAPTNGERVIGLDSAGNKVETRCVAGRWYWGKGRLWQPVGWLPLDK